MVAQGKESTCKCREHQRSGFDPWVKKMSWRAQQPTLIFLLGESRRSLVGCSPKATEHARTKIFQNFFSAKKVFLNEQNYIKHVDYHLSNLLRVTRSQNCVSCKLCFLPLRMSQSNWEGRCVHICLAEQEYPNGRIYRVAQCGGYMLDCKNLRDGGSSADSPTSPWLDIAETPFSFLRHGYYNTYNTGLC